jgi:hypothetical protein
VAATIRATDFPSPTSVATNWTRTSANSSFRRSTAPSPPASSISATMTDAPSHSSARAASKPMPPAPVTMATCPARASGRSFLMQSASQSSHSPRPGLSLPSAGSPAYRQRTQAPSLQDDPQKCKCSALAVGGPHHAVRTHDAPLQITRWNARIQPKPNGFPFQGVVFKTPPTYGTLWLLSLGWGHD